MESELITKITVVTTFLTALATFYTVFEIRWQRQAAYRPDIFVSDAFRGFFGYDQNDIFKRFRYEISKESLKEKNQTHDEPMLWFEIQIYNIGFGAAKFVEYEWEFNFKKFYDLLLSINNPKIFNLEYKKDNKSEDVYIKTANDEHLTSLNWDKRFFKSQFDFLNPSSTGKNNQAITIPEAYIDMLSYYLCLKYEMKDINSEKVFIQDDLLEIPKLYVKLKYNDIGNKNHKKKFLLSFSALGNFSSKKELFSNRKLGTYLIVSKEI